MNYFQNATYLSKNFDSYYLWNVNAFCADGYNKYFKQH